MEVEKLSPHIGARVSRFDLRDLRPGNRGMMRDLLEEHLVLFFVGQSLNPKEFKAYGQVIGELHNLDMLENLGGETPEILVVEAKHDPVRGEYTDTWHSDACYMECPPYATTITPALLPPLGGDTLWASMYAAYDLLSEPLKRLAEGLTVVQAAGPYEWIHPVVRVNPRTGRRGLYVNSIFSKSIPGMSKLESAKVIDMFCALATVPDVQVRYRWTSDTVAIWDNRFTQHYAVNDYAPHPRRMHRLSIVGEPAAGVRSSAMEP